MMFQVLVVGCTWMESNDGFNLSFPKTHRFGLLEMFKCWWWGFILRMSCFGSDKFLAGSVNLFVKKSSNCAQTSLDVTSVRIMRVSRIDCHP